MTNQIIGTKSLILSSVLFLKRHCTEITYELESIGFGNHQQACYV